MQQATIGKTTFFNALSGRIEGTLIKEDHGILSFKVGPTNLDGLAALCQAAGYNKAVAKLKSLITARMNSLEPELVRKQIAELVAILDLQTLAEESRCSTVLFEVLEFTPEPNQIATRSPYGELETFTESTPDPIQWVRIAPFAEADPAKRQAMEALR